MSDIQLDLFGGVDEKEYKKLQEKCQALEKKLAALENRCKDSSETVDEYLDTINKLATELDLYREKYNNEFSSYER